MEGKYPLLPPPDGDPDEGWKRIETQAVKEEGATIASLLFPRAASRPAPSL